MNKEDLNEDEYEKIICNPYAEEDGITGKNYFCNFDTDEEDAKGLNMFLSSIHFSKDLTHIVAIDGEGWGYRKYSKSAIEEMIKKLTDIHNKMTKVEELFN